MNYSMCAEEVSLISGSPYFMKMATALCDGDIERFNMVGSAQKAGVDLKSDFSYVKGVEEVASQVVADMRQDVPSKGAVLS